MIYLSRISLKTEIPKVNEYPYNLSFVKRFTEIEIKTPVTFLVGENGSGKSTFLESIARAMELPAIGNKDTSTDDSLAEINNLADSWRLAWKIKSHQGFFLRAEDVFGFTTRVKTNIKYLQEEAKELGNQLTGYGRSLAMGALLGQANALKRSYGDNPDGRSHGELFLELLKKRITPNGIYLMDEPETPLSFRNQLALLYLLIDSTRKGSQFMIATHSPVLTLLPNVQILSFDQGMIKEIKYEEIEQFVLLKNFLNNPEKILRELLA